MSDHATGVSKGHGKWGDDNVALCWLLNLVQELDVPEEPEAGIVIHLLCVLVVVTVLNCLTWSLQQHQGVCGGASE